MCVLILTEHQLTSSAASADARCSHPVNYHLRRLCPHASTPTCLQVQTAMFVVWPGLRDVFEQLAGRGSEVSFSRESVVCDSKANRHHRSSRSVLSKLSSAGPMRAPAIARGHPTAIHAGHAATWHRRSRSPAIIGCIMAQCGVAGSWHSVGSQGRGAVRRPCAAGRAGGP